VVRLNPVKHGVLSQTPVVGLVERAEDWERLRDGIFECLGVQGMLEEALAERIAMTFWRLYRVVRLETEAIETSMREVPRDYVAGLRAAKQPIPTEATPEVVEEMDRMLMSRLLPGDVTLEKVMRYEGRQHRYLLQTLHQFMVVKGLRKPGGRYFGAPDLNPPGLRDLRGASRTPQVVELTEDEYRVAPDDETRQG
jgi:hypothetical protein